MNQILVFVKGKLTFRNFLTEAKMTFTVAKFEKHLADDKARHTRT